VSFLLDPPALLVLGFIAGKIYNLSMVFADRLLRRGPLKRELFITGTVIVLIFWIYSSLLYLNTINFPWPFAPMYGGTDWMLNSGLPLGVAKNQTTDIIAVIVFATYPFWFYLGTKLSLAGHRLTNSQKIRERNKIIEEVVKTMYPKGGAIQPGASEIGSAKVVENLLTKIPALYCDALTMLFFVFDSRFLVLVFTGKWRRFVQLDDSEKLKYVEAWESNSFLSGAAEVFNLTTAYSYYTNRDVYERIGYNGPMIPNLPPWYNPGDSS